MTGLGDFVSSLRSQHWVRQIAESQDTDSKGNLYASNAKSNT